jgi:DNA-binding NtrC family response regulator
MTRYTANEITTAPEAFGLSPMHVTCVRHLVGHALGVIERELILQTLKCSQGNRTRAAGVLGISVRSLRDRIRTYREEGADVMPPASPSLDHPTQSFAPPLEIRVDD